MKPSETSGEPSVGGGVSLLTVEAERESLNLSRVQAERLAKSADLVRAANTVFEAALAAGLPARLSEATRRPRRVEPLRAQAGVRDFNFRP